MGAYSSAIWQALVFFPIAALLFTLPYVLYNYHKYGSVLGLRIAIVYSFVLYLLCVYCLVILPLPSVQEVAAMTGPRMQLRPFQFVRDIAHSAHVQLSQPSSFLSLLKNHDFLQVLFNVCMTLPFGVYLRYYFRCRFGKTLLCSFLLSLFFELTQLSGLYFIYPRSYRLFDVDDLLANTLGGVLGFALVGPFLQLLPTREEIDAASLRRGRQVSCLRRVCAFACDLLCAGLLYTVLRLLLDHWGRSLPGLTAIVFLSYFLLASLLTRGGSAGKCLTRTRVVSACGQPARWQQYLLRYALLYASLFLPPYLLAQVLSPALRRAGFAGSAFLCDCVLWGAYLLCLLLAVIKVSTHRPLFYEKLSRTRVVSTIAAAGRGQGA